MKNISSLTIAIAIVLGATLLFNFQNCAASNEIDPNDENASHGPLTISFLTFGNGAITGPRPNIKFKISDPSVPLICLLDGVAVPCDATNGVTLAAALATGAHTLNVTGLDHQGAQVAVTLSWNVDAAGPGVVITGPGNGAGTAASGQISFTIGDGVTAECTFDGTLSACVSPYTYSNLLDGNHSMSIRAIDAYGNMGAASSVTFSTSGHTL